MSAPGAEERPFIVVTEVADGAEFAEPIFQKTARPHPDTDGTYPPFIVERGTLDCGRLSQPPPLRAAMLIGGACTDGEILRTLPEGRADGSKQTVGSCFNSSATAKRASLPSRSAPSATAVMRAHGQSSPNAATVAWTIPT
jgi:hypothetical protein